MDDPGNIFHVNFFGYAHCFISIIISHMKDHSISVDRDRYATSIVDNYFDTATVHTSTNFYNTTFPLYIIFARADAYTSDDQVEKLTREFNICYRDCIGSLIYFYLQ